MASVPNESWRWLCDTHPGLADECETAPSNFKNNPYAQYLADLESKFEQGQRDVHQDLDFCFTKTNGLNSRWGPWVFQENLTLYHGYAKYEIDLEEISSILDVVQWLDHMSRKNVHIYGVYNIYFLSHAFRDIIQHAGFSYATHNSFNGTSVAKKYLQALQPKRCVSVRTRHKVLERDRFRCQDCGASAANGAELEVDHTIPVSKGGSNDISNLRTLCKDCNRGKADRIVNYEPVSLFDSDT